MTSDWDKRSRAARGCVFAAYGPLDDLRQGGASGCAGLWPGGELALNIAFHNEVAVACPHRRTTTRRRAIHFQNPFSLFGVDLDAPSMTVCTQNYVKGAETPSRIPAAIL